jgi:zinc protease
MKRPPALVLVGLALLALAPVAGSAAESWSPEVFQLDNGLQVVLHVDRRLPQVAVNVWYHVGSREEPLGRSGFAHLFEHLMFMGTERVPGSQFDEIMEGGGGQNNASTDFDRTNYFSWGPAGLLPTLLWLEADRMEGVGAAMTQEKLDLQRDVVRNERREAYDNAPYGPSQLRLLEELFPHGHPYHFHVIGSHEDLLAATVEDVKSFFSTFYVPNNATLVVAGDFDRAEVKALIVRLFGSLPRGAPIPRRLADPVSLEQQKRVTLHDDVQLPRLTLAWHSPPFYAEGDAEMDVLAGILGEGRKSRLYERLVHEAKVAVDVSAWQWSLRLGSVFGVEVTAAPGVDPEALEAAVEEEIQRLRNQDVRPEEIERVRNRIETDTVAHLQSLREVADRMNQYAAYLGHPDRLGWDLARYRRVAPDGLRAWARQVLARERLVLWVHPRPEPAAGPGRDVRPPDFVTPPFVPPVATTFRLSNGLPVWHVPGPDVPLVALRLVLFAGAADDPRAQAGRAALTAQMLREGAGPHDALQFAERLERLGAHFSTAATQDTTTVDLQVLAARFQPALALFAAAVVEPRFDAESWERVRKQALDRFPGVLDDPMELAVRVADEAFHGPGGAYGPPARGYPETVAALTREDVAAFRAARYRPDRAVLLVTGGLAPEAARAALEAALGAWRGGGDAPAAAPTASAPAPPLRVLLVDRPGAAQTVARFVLQGPSYADADRPGLAVLNTVFGGSFTSRLNANLRERNGYTYGASSRFDHRARGGVWVAGASVETAVTGAALTEFRREFARLAGGGVTAEEATKGRATVLADTVQAFETLGGALALHQPLARHGLAPAVLRADLEAVEAQDAARLDRLAAAHADLGHGVLVLVGDAAAIRPQLEGLGWPPPQVITPADALAGRWE